MQFYCLSGGTTDSAVVEAGARDGGIILERGKCDDEKLCAVVVLCKNDCY